MRLPALRSRRRSAFTLIELLTVIAIIAILVALAAGAYFRLSSAQYIKRTEATMKSTQTGFDAQWRATIDDAKEDVKKGKVSPTLLGLVGGDRDTANSLWVLMRLSQEFPQSFYEVYNFNTAYGSFGLQVKQSYLQGLNSATATGAPEESAVLLFLALSQSRRGVQFNVDDIGAGSIKVITVGGQQFKVIVDAWGTPITFERFAQDAALAAELTQIAQSNPLDPFNKLINLSAALKSYFSQLVYASSPAQNQSLNMFDGPYHGPVLRSAGPDRSLATNNDDIIGFRLMREGQKGN